MAKPTWISTQSPSLDAVWAAGHQRDVDDAAYTCHVDPGQEPFRIAELDDLPWDR